jgi:stage III sporulation protein SpoIIIAA
MSKALKIADTVNTTPEIDAELVALLEKLPPQIRQSLMQQSDINNLLEVVIDLGRPAEARFPDREMILTAQEVGQEDIDYVTSRISEFGDDNRAGIARTLHRISAIRNRSGHIVGLTCRVGRAVFGTVKIIEDLIRSGKSVLLLGRPGIGKTTMLREAARVLSVEAGKRVVIVDTSNEIAGDGDIPHPAIGHSRRMQVRTPSQQHAVMIEAVENHMPEVIIIDEIGTELETMAARTIAERGVQLIGTAHGNTLENLMVNPTLSDLVGGIQSVTLGDEEAKRRGTQKTILERKSPPTFDIVVEIQDRYRVAVHPVVAESVDASLRGQPCVIELRSLENGEVVVKRQEPMALPGKDASPAHVSIKHKETPRMYLFGINRERLEDEARELGININLTDNLNEADLLITSKAYFRRKPLKIREAEASNLPIYVLRKPNPQQIRHMLTILNPQVKNGGDNGTQHQEMLAQALKEAEQAASNVRQNNEPVELNPQGAYIRRLQHLIAERNNLSSKSMGRDPDRHVMFYRER